VVPDHLLPQPLDQVDIPDPQLDHPPLLRHAPILGNYFLVICCDKTDEKGLFVRANPIK
jgi:hypothetical protein